MLRVVDTSVIIAVVTNEAQKSALIAQTQGAHLFAPASLPGEIGNAFSAMLRRERITVAQAQAAIVAYRQVILTLVPIDLAAAVALSGRLRIYAYDAYMIDCALRLSAPLLTLDTGLQIAARTAGVIVPDITLPDIETEETTHADLS